MPVAADKLRAATVEPRAVPAVIRLSANPEIAAAECCWPEMAAGAVPLTEHLEYPVFGRQAADSVGFAPRPPPLPE